jgi:hypothetical protein
VAPPVPDAAKILADSEASMKRCQSIIYNRLTHIRDLLHMWNAGDVGGTLRVL